MYFKADKLYLMVVTFASNVDIHLGYKYDIDQYQVPALNK